MADWHTLGQVNYRKWAVYEHGEMGWNMHGERLNVEDYTLYGAPFGGPLAMIKVDSDGVSENVTSVSSGSSVANSAGGSKVLVFTASGKKISEIDLLEVKTNSDIKSRIAGIGWSDQEQLIIVLEDGTVLVYNAFGRLIKKMPIVDSTYPIQILECAYWGDGVVTICSEFQLHVIDGLASPDLSTVRRYSMETSLNGHRPHTSLSLISPMLSRSGMLEVLVGTIDGSIIIVDETEAQDQQVQQSIGSPVTKMAVAPNGRFLAAYRRDGILTVLSTSFTTKVLDFDTKSMSVPLQIEWCGDDAIALLWKNNGIVMVGPYGDCLVLPYEDEIHIVSEQDCCRVISSHSCDMIQRVPQSTEAIKKIGSTDPAALLYDAMEAFEDGDPKSDENIRSIAATNQLETAVEACIAAAAAEFDVSRQQSFLRAASYGKSFCPNMDPSSFVNTARKIRVMNNVRHIDIGIPLTIQQFNKLTAEVLVSRLTFLNHHLLALQICDLLNLNTEGVLLHWACEKIKKLATTSTPDEEITLAITRRLSGRGRISYLEIANTAFMMGRRRLATMILDMEQNAAEQIPLLLSMKEDELALQKAVNSADSDLIYLTLFNLEKSRDRESFFKHVHIHMDAVSLLKIYYKTKVIPSEKGLLYHLLTFSKNHFEIGVMCWRQAYMQSNFQQRLQMMREASSHFDKSRDLSLYKTTMDEQVDLLEIQKMLETRAQSEFIGLTTVQTVKKLFRLAVEFSSEAARWDQEALKIIKKFKISDKIVWHFRVDVLAEMGEWATMKRYATEKKPLIGFKPFAVACMKYNQPMTEIEFYIDRIDSKEEKFDLYIDLEIWGKAVDIAYKLKDPFRLQEVGRLCKDSTLQVDEHCFHCFHIISN